VAPPCVSITSHRWLHHCECYVAEHTTRGPSSQYSRPQRSGDARRSWSRTIDRDCKQFKRKTQQAILPTKEGPRVQGKAKPENQYGAWSLQQGPRIRCLLLEQITTFGDARRCQERATTGKTNRWHPWLTINNFAAGFLDSKSGEPRADAKL
jgi:hypothetical protein